MVSRVVLLPLLAITVTGQFMGGMPMGGEMGPPQAPFPMSSGMSPPFGASRRFGGMNGGMNGGFGGMNGGMGSDISAPFPSSGGISGPFPSSGGISGPLGSGRRFGGISDGMGSSDISAPFPSSEINSPFGRRRFGGMNGGGPFVNGEPRRLGSYDNGGVFVNGEPRRLGSYGTGTFGQSSGSFGQSGNFGQGSFGQSDGSFGDGGMARYRGGRSGHQPGVLEKIARVIDQKFSDE